jgi:hypothetical protein
LVPVSLYIVHEVSVGAVGSRWSVSNGVTQFVSLGYTCGGVSISGDPADGVMVGYGGCVASPHSACRLDYMKLTGDPIVGCYHMRVEPFPGDSDVLVTDCAMVDKAATGGYFSFELPPHSCDDCAVGIETTTWGSVKALYR